MMKMTEQTKREIRERQKALRQAWPHRHGLRGRIVVRVNASRLRDLKGST